MSHWWRNYKKIGFLCFFVGSTCSSYAQISEQESIRIEADQMSYDTKNEIAEASGSAWAKQKDKKITADRLIVLFEEKGSQPSSPGETTEISKGIREIVANGNVYVTMPDKNISATYGRYDVAQEILSFFGKNIVLKTPNGLLQAHESLSYDQKSQKATARGDVYIISEKHQIKAPYVYAYFKKGSSSEATQDSLTLDCVEAKGGVMIKDPKYISTAKEASYCSSTGMVHLKGQVILSDGRNVFTGEQAEYDEKTGKGRLLSTIDTKEKPQRRVRALLYGKKKKDR